MTTRLTPYFATHKARALLNSATVAVDVMVDWLVELDERITVLESDPVAPVNTSLPVISGTLLPDNTLTCSAGSWTGVPFPSITYQWKSGGVNISGATSNTYDLTDSDIGNTITCTVTGTNTQGSDSATSEGVVIESPYEAPDNVSLPTISGNAYSGHVLTCSTGIWTGAPTPTYAYQWKADGSNISGATSSTYEIDQAEGVVITCTVTASNSEGNSSVTTEGITVVEEPAPADNPFDALYDSEFSLVSNQTFYSKPTVSKPAKMTNLTTPGYTDSNFGTKVFRLSDVDDPDDTVTSLRHVYSRQTAFNCDGTKLLVRASNGWWHLYDATTGEKLNGGRTQTPGLGAVNGLVNECEAFWHPTDPNKIWYTGNQGMGMVWNEFDITTNTSTVLFNLGPKITALGAEWSGANRAWFKGEGRPSNDGRWFGLLVQTSGFGLIGFIMYDRVNDEIVGSQLCTNMPDHCSTSPLGNYIVISWYSGTAERLDLAATRGINECNGARAYSRDFSTFTQLSSLGEHSDLAIDADGNEVFVSITYRGGEFGQEYDVEDGGIYYRRMDTGEAFNLPGNAYGDSSDSACHFSGLATQKPGWVVVGWYGGTPATWKDGVLCAVELVPSNPRVLRLAHHHSVYGGNYINEPHACPSQDLSRVVFASNYGGSVAEDYFVGLPSWAIPVAGGESAPANISAPVVSGTPEPTETLSCTTGSWTGTGNTYAYQWRKNGVNVSGATSSTFSVPGTGYPNGTTVDCRVTATNTNGSSTATSNEVVISVGAAPVNTVAPVVSGASEVGDTATVTNGTWSGSPTSYSYQWQLDSSNISGATSSSYTTEAEGSLRCVVSATNDDGTTAANSNALTITQPVEPGELGIIQSKGAGATGSDDVTVALDSATTSGNMLVAAVIWQAGNSDVPTITDNAGSTWTQQGTTQEVSNEGYTYYLAVLTADDITGTASPSITATKQFDYPTLIVTEVEGAAGVDTYAAAGVSAPPFVSPEVTPSGDGRLFLTFAATFDHTNAVPTTSFTSMTDLPVGTVTYWTMTSSYYKQETAAALTPGFTLTPSNPAVVGTLVLS